MKLDILLTMAKAMEIVDERENVFGHPTNRAMLPETVSKVDMKKVQRLSDSSKAVYDNECSCCGYKGHFASDLKCPARGKMCDGCNGKYHFRKKCKSKQFPKQGRKRNINENRNYHNKRRSQGKHD